MLSLFFSIIQLNSPNHKKMNYLIIFVILSQVCHIYKKLRRLSPVTECVVYLFLDWTMWTN